eukprot:3816518-Rhodomonas_salina.2
MGVVARNQRRKSTLPVQTVLQLWLSCIESRRVQVRTTGYGRAMGCLFGEGRRSPIVLRTPYAIPSTKPSVCCYQEAVEFILASFLSGTVALGCYTRATRCPVLT